MKIFTLVSVFYFLFSLNTLFFSSTSQAGGVRANIKAAGCFIPTPKGVVVGIGRLTGKLHIPIGSHKRGETAEDTALRETKEETGIDVSIGHLLKTFENNTVYLFFCSPKISIDDYSKLKPLDLIEIAEVLVIDPGTMLNYDGRKIENQWRFPDDGVLLIRLFKEYKNRN